MKFFNHKMIPASFHKNKINQFKNQTKGEFELRYYVSKLWVKLYI